MKRRAGFSLVELLVVLVIIGLLMALVGPFSVQQAEKAQAQREWLAFKRMMEEASFRAYIAGRGVDINFRGKAATFRSGGKESDFDFQYLFFPVQTLQINSHGMPSVPVISLVRRGRPVSYRLYTENELAGEGV